MTSINRFRTYGFLTALVAMQMTAPSVAYANSLADKTDRAGTDSRKSARAMKSDLKKGARKATGQDNAWDRTKDNVSEGSGNIQDEAGYQERKAERKEKGDSNE